MKRYDLTAAQLQCISTLRTFDLLTSKLHRPLQEPRNFFH